MLVSLCVLPPISRLGLLTAMFGTPSIAGAARRATRGRSRTSGFGVETPHASASADSSAPLMRADTLGSASRAHAPSRSGSTERPCLADSSPSWLFDSDPSSAPHPAKNKPEMPHTTNRRIVDMPRNLPNASCIADDLDDDH